MFCLYNKMVLFEYLMVMMVFSVVTPAPTDSAETSAETNKKIAKQCFGKHDLTKELVEDFQKNPEDPPKRILCYMKCFLEHKGLLDEDGNLNMDYVSGESYGDDVQSLSNEDDSMESDDGLDEHETGGESTEEDLECLKRLGPIRSCNDMRGVLKCLPTLRQK